MVWITNIYDPQYYGADRYIIRSSHETQQEAVEQHRQYLSDKIIGPPKATEKYTQEQLEKMGIVGVYVQRPDEV